MCFINKTSFDPLFVFHRITFTKWYSYLPTCSSSVDSGFQGDNRTASRPRGGDSSRADWSLKVEKKSLLTALQITLSIELVRSIDQAQILFERFYKRTNQYQYEP